MIKYLILVLLVLAGPPLLARLPFDTAISNNTSDIIARMGEPHLLNEQNNFVLLSFPSRWLSTNGNLYFLMRYNSNLVFATFVPDNPQQLPRLQQRVSRNRHFVAVTKQSLSLRLDELLAERQFQIFNQVQRARLLIAARSFTDALNVNNLAFLEYDNFYMSLNGSVTVDGQTKHGIAFMLADEYLWELMLNIIS
ncbi:MAG: hypothetical protein FWE37_06395 [Spirochaetaceae bacterium]|nr:hypothetical protein [Spirochaetaceae bacterium]